MKLIAIVLALTAVTAQAAEVKSFPNEDACFNEEVKSSHRLIKTTATSPSGEYWEWSAVVYKGKVLTFNCFVDTPAVTIESKKEYQERVDREKKEFQSKK
jgi:hypothetical protein